MDKNLANKLDKECNRFCYYLIKQMPNKYVVEKYHDAHRVGSIKQSEISSFDNLLISIALINPFFTKLVDVYTGIFFKASIFRKKLILLIAILESCAPTCYYLDSVTQSGKAMFYVRMSYKTLFFIFSLFVSGIIFMPIHTFYKTVMKS